MTEKKAVHFPFTYGGDPEMFCSECQLPCSLEEMNLDCHRRFFLQGLIHCSYFVYGRCFLIGEPGCVFDNGGRYDKYWLQLLNDYFHNVSRREEDAEFLAQREEVLKLVDDQIVSQNVYYCRYLESYYNQIMQAGGGLGEEMMDKLDEAYLDLLRGISRKTD